MIFRIENFNEVSQQKIISWQVFRNTHKLNRPILKLTFCNFISVEFDNVNLTEISIVVGLSDDIQNCMFIFHRVFIWIRLNDWLLNTRLNSPKFKIAKKRQLWHKLANIQKVGIDYESEDALVISTNLFKCRNGKIYKYHYCPECSAYDFKFGFKHKIRFYHKCALCCMRERQQKLAVSLW